MKIGLVCPRRVISMVFKDRELYTKQPDRSERAVHKDASRTCCRLPQVSFCAGPVPGKSLIFLNASSSIFLLWVWSQTNVIKAILGWTVYFANCNYAIGWSGSLFLTHCLTLYLMFFSRASRLAHRNLHFLTNFNAPARIFVQIITWEVNSS